LRDALWWLTDALWIELRFVSVDRPSRARDLPGQNNQGFDATLTKRVSDNINRLSSCSVGA
jgi:hypothetical protein